MALPSSGPITLKMLQDEFGGSDPISLSEYYRNGGLVPSNNTSVPTSGAISLSDFYGAVNEIVVTLANTGSRVVASSLFGGGLWESTVPKRIIIPNNVVVGSSNPSVEAFLIDTGMGGVLNFDVSGRIEGASGPANGGTGGNALIVNQSSGVTVNITSTGSILGGGGGGGKGGTGGSGGGGVYYTTRVDRLGGAYSNCSDSYGADCETLCDWVYGSSSYCSNCQDYYCDDDYVDPNSDYDNYVGDYGDSD